VRVFIAAGGYADLADDRTPCDAATRVPPVIDRRHTRTGRRRIALVALAATALVATACGGDETDGAAAEAPAGGGAAAPVAPTDAPAAVTGAPATAPVASEASGTSAAPAPTSAAAAGTTAPAPAPDALRFTAPLVGGGSIDAASLAGQPVLFWFWAPY
jgi:hypothetical protein